MSFVTGAAEQYWASDSVRNGHEAALGCSSFSSRTTEQSRHAAEPQRSSTELPLRTICLRNGDAWHDWTCASRRKGQRTA